MTVWTCFLRHIDAYFARWIAGLVLAVAALLTAPVQAQLITEQGGPGISAELRARLEASRDELAAKFTSPGGKELNSVLLKPVPITKDNLNVVLDAGWITKETLCAGVTGGVAVCE